jgi:hypothetical protein
VDEIFSVPGGPELLAGVQRASETGEIVKLGGPVTVKGESWNARLSPLAHGRVMVILRHDGEEGRRSFALGTELPRRATSDVRALPSASGTNPPPDDATPVSTPATQPAQQADEPSPRPPARTR